MYLAMLYEFLSANLIGDFLFTASWKSIEAVNFCSEPLIFIVSVVESGLTFAFLRFAAVLEGASIVNSFYRVSTESRAADLRCKFSKTLPVIERSPVVALLRGDPESPSRDWISYLIVVGESVLLLSISYSCFSPVDPSTRV